MSKELHTLRNVHLPGGDDGHDPAMRRPQAYAPLSYEALHYADLYGRATPNQKGTFVVVGAGAAGFNMAHSLLAHGYRLLQIISHNHAEAGELARRLGRSNVTVSSDVQRLEAADWVLLTVPDDAIAGVAMEMAPVVQPQTCVLHVAGSQPLDLLEPLGENIGVCWPMQTLSRSRAVNLRSVPLFVEGTPTSQASLERMARELSDRVVITDYNARLRLHIGAVFAANFVNLMVRLAGDLALSVPGADYSIYLPLLNEVVAKLDQMTPHQAQTGPAVRGDRQTIEEHLRVLHAHDPQLAALYDTLTGRILG